MAESFQFLKRNLHSLSSSLSSYLSVWWQTEQDSLFDHFVHVQHICVAPIVVHRQFQQKLFYFSYFSTFLLLLIHFVRFLHLFQLNSTKNSFHLNVFEFVLFFFPVETQTAGVLSEMAPKVMEKVEKIFVFLFCFHLCSVQIESRNEKIHFWSNANALFFFFLISIWSLLSSACFRIQSTKEYWKRERKWARVEVVDDDRPLSSLKHTTTDTIIGAQKVQRLKIDNFQTNSNNQIEAIVQSNKVVYSIASILSIRD